MQVRRNLMTRPTALIAPHRLGQQGGSLSDRLWRRVHSHNRAAAERSISSARGQAILVGI